MGFQRVEVQPIYRLRCSSMAGVQNGGGMVSFAHVAHNGGVQAHGRMVHEVAAREVWIMGRKGGGRRGWWGRAQGTHGSGMVAT